jgi:hypothetical protein
LFIVDTANQTIRIGRPDPPLQTTHSSGQLIVSWPSWTTAYQLEQSSMLTPASWSPYPAFPTVVGDRKFVTNAPTEATQFFRLRRP